MLACYSSLVPRGMRQFVTYFSRGASIIHLFPNNCLYPSPISQCLLTCFTYSLMLACYSSLVAQGVRLYLQHFSMPALMLHLFLNAWLFFFTCTSRYALFFIYFPIPVSILHLFLKVCLYSSSILQCLLLRFTYSLILVCYSSPVPHCLHLFFIYSARNASVLHRFLKPWLYS